MKVSCNVIKDILPLYAEDMVSKDTKELVDGHICDCESCKQELDQIKKASEIPLCSGNETFKKVNKMIRVRRIRAVALAVLIMLSAFVTVFILSRSSFYINEEDAIEKVYVNEEGSLVVKFKEGIYDFNFHWDEDRKVKHVHAYFWPLRSMYVKPNDPGGYEMKFGLAEDTEAIVYGWNNSPIWGNTDQTHVHPEQLVMLGTMIAAIAGGIICLSIYRKKKAEGTGKALLNIGVFCSCYAASNLIVFKCDPRFYGVGWGSDVPQMMIIFLIMTVLYYGSAMLIIRNKKDKELL